MKNSLRQRLQRARLYVLVDAQQPIARWETLLRDLVDAGVDVIQLRDKSLCDRELLERGRCLRKLTRASETIFVMNDRADLAVLVEADGVHVGQDELPPREVRKIVGVDMLIGVSTHSLDQARHAVGDGADYIGVGPVFPSQTKDFDGFPGLDLLRRVSREIDLPAYAIGGIDQENLPRVLETGMSRVAVRRAISVAHNPREVVRAMKRRLSYSLKR